MKGGISSGDLSDSAQRLTGHDQFVCCINDLDVSWNVLQIKSDLPGMKIYNWRHWSCPTKM